GNGSIKCEARGYVTMRCGSTIEHRSRIAQPNIGIVCHIDGQRPQCGKFIQWVVGDSAGRGAKLSGCQTREELIQAAEGNLNPSHCVERRAVRIWGVEQQNDLSSRMRLTVNLSRTVDDLADILVGERVADNNEL